MPIRWSSKRLPEGGEHALQTRVVNRIRRLPHPWFKVCYAIPNAALDTGKKRRYFVTEGVLPGIPDICIPWPRLSKDGRVIGACYLELKWGDNEPSKEQVAVMEVLAQANNVSYVCYSEEDVFKAIEHYANL